MEQQYDFKKLREPFKADEIEFRIQQSGYIKSKSKPWAMVLCYITNRAAQNRLDKILGPLNWQESYRILSNGAVISTIQIWDENKKQWISKEDGAQETDIERIKGGLSSASKRTASKLGIGRYLYSLPIMFANINPNGNHKACIKVDNKNGLSKPLYFKWSNPVLPKEFLPKENK